MTLIVPESRSRTSAQIALEDNTFHELFGMIWKNTGYIIESLQDLSWTIFYKDFFLLVLSDYVNEGYSKIPNDRTDLAYDSAKAWLNDINPFNNTVEIIKYQSKMWKVRSEFLATNPKRTKLEIFQRKYKKAMVDLYAMNQPDPFNIQQCCDVLGLKVEEVRARFKLYRTLKLKYGHNIRIVSYTGSKKIVNIPSIEDIIESEEANGEHDPALFLHIGVKRELRNRALARSKYGRNDKRRAKDQ